MKSKRRVFMCKLPVVNYVILGVLCVLSMLFVVWGILRLAEVGRFYSFNPVVDVIVVVADLLVTAFIVLLTVLTRFVVRPDCFVVQRIVPTRIPIERLLLLRHEVSENVLVLYYADEAAPEGVRFVVLRVFDRDMPLIVQAIQEANPQVSYEMFDNSRKDSND